MAVYVKFFKSLVAMSHSNTVSVAVGHISEACKSVKAILISEACRSAPALNFYALISRRVAKYFYILATCS
jgi:hypothetical protein